MGRPRNVRLLLLHGWLIHGALKTGEQIDDISGFEDAIALSPDVSLADNTRGLEAVDGLSGPHLGTPDQSCGALDGDHWDTGLTL